MLRRPFLVEAVGLGGAWAGWWVSGWRRARRARDDISFMLDAGTDASEIDPADAFRFAPAE